MIERGDEVIIEDPRSRFYGCTGVVTVVGRIACTVQLHDGASGVFRKDLVSK